MAEELGTKIGGKDNVEVIVKNVSETSLGDMVENDMLIFGCSTWGNGELQDDFLTFVPTLEQAEISGKKTAVFGLGETSWPEFCAAVEIIEEIVTKRGAKVVDNIKIDGDYNDFENEINDWIDKII
jgi:flavodoxin I